MSHVVDIDCEITDLPTLDAACASLGLELVRGQGTFQWYGLYVGDAPLPVGFTEADLGRCEHAIRVPGNGRAYEVGVVRRRDGRPGYTLLYDNWRGGLGMSELAGDRCERIVQAYAVERVKRTVARTHRVEQHRMADGSVRLVLQGVR